MIINSAEVVQKSCTLFGLTFMTEKHIVIYEKNDGVRFVLEQSLSKYREGIEISSSHWKNEIKRLMYNHEIDLLITELSRFNSDGFEISKYARKLDPNLKIIWITASGCNLFQDDRKNFGNVKCIEKPLEIYTFRKNVLNALNI